MVYRDAPGCRKVGAPAGRTPVSRPWKTGAPPRGPMWDWGREMFEEDLGTWENQHGDGDTGRGARATALWGDAKLVGDP